MRTLKTVQTELATLSQQALRIIDNPQLTTTKKLAQLAPLEAQIKTTETELADVQFVGAQRRKLHGLTEVAHRHDDSKALAASVPVGFKALAAAQWGDDVQRRIQERAGAVSAKDLVNGSVGVPSIVREPVEISGRPTSILELIPREPGRASGTDEAGNAYTYLIQTARSLNAAAVPDGAAKPVSDVTFEEREDRYRVYAHVTEPMPKRFLDDYRGLVAILQKQLGEGLMESLERDIVQGTGVATSTTDPVRGILHTPGIIASAFDTDALTSLSNARYTLEDSSVRPTAWLLNSRDLQKLERLRENGTTGALLFGTGRTSLEQYLGEYPIVTSPLVAEGTAIIGDFTQTGLYIREDDHLDVDGSGELFTKNQVVFRHEGRYGFAVGKPSAFAKVALKA